MKATLDYLFPRFCP